MYETFLDLLRKLQFPQKCPCFLGLYSYYKKFVTVFVTSLDILHKLTEMYQKSLRTNELEDAFKKLKQPLTSAPVLPYPHTSK